jgi:redox-sensitive bicupin YhaK (pirin superfamily)
MTMILRKAADRGRSDFGWLDSRHTFSFGHYRDPRYMGFATLRVINDDRVAPGAGFPEHPHADMEIVTCVLDGALAHRDTLGNNSVISAGEVQRMSAGTGIRHSEYNASQTEPVHFLQIWVTPERSGLPPGYEQRPFSVEQKRARLCLIGSRDGRDGSVTVHQDIDIYAVRLAAGDEVRHAPGPARSIWIHIARGSIAVNGQALAEGDGVAITTPGALILSGTSDGEALLFDMAG